MKNDDIKRRLLNTVNVVLESDLDVKVSISKPDSFDLKFDIKDRSDPFTRDIYTVGSIGANHIDEKQFTCYISFYSQYDCPLVSFVIVKNNNYLAAGEEQVNTRVYLISNAEFNQYRKKLYLYNVMKANTQYNYVFKQYCNVIEENYNKEEVINTLDDIL